MTQEQRRSFLIDRLLSERDSYREISVSNDVSSQRNLLRSLMNVRPAADTDEAFLRIQDDYLREAIREKGITDVSELIPVRDGLYIWQGDISTLRCDAIVNAANSGMTGCYQPCHNCIDNCIHSFAGVQLRRYCASLMEKQGFAEPTGQAKITPAFNLPCRYILHTVGPIVDGRLNERHRRQLASCYTSCLTLAQENGCTNIAFCCISTGVFGFPQKDAAEIAVRTVQEYKQQTNSKIEVIFNVFKDTDREIYRSILA